MNALRLFSIGLLLTLTFLTRSNSASNSNRPDGSAIDLSEAQALGDRFTDQLLATQDLAPVIRAMYVDKFMERHIAACQRARSRDSAAPYAPSFGLFMDYKRELLAQASAAHNASFLLFACVLQKAISNHGLPEDESDVWPEAVRSLIDGNSLLSQHFHNSSASLSSVEDLRSTSETLERVAARLRKEPAVKRLNRTDIRTFAQGLADKGFKPRVLSADPALFDLPEGSRIIKLVTPVGLDLYVSREDKQLKVFWAHLALGE